MAKVSSHGGHNAIIQGANWGSRKEHVMDRECNTMLINKLRALGHDVKNDTDDVGTTKDMIVNNQVRNINSRYNDVGFSWHLNASDTLGHGVEVLCYSEKEAPMARKISAEIAKRTGWKDRGAKLRPDLGVIRSTACPVFLIEAGFIDNDSDMAKWNVDKITSAVIFAYFGQETGNGGGSNIEPPKVEQKYPTEWRQGRLRCNVNVNLRQNPSVASSILEVLPAGSEHTFYAIVPDNDGIHWWYDIGGGRFVREDNVKEI